MRLALVHARAQLAYYMRFPAYTVPTVLFPALFFFLFVAPRSEHRVEAKLFAAGYLGFAALAVAFFQFGVGTAAERTTPWETYVRTLPVSATSRLVGRSLAAIPFVLASCSVVFAVAVATTPARFSAAEVAALAAATFAGCVPFVLLGFALGYWVSPRGALPLANLLYLVLSFAGGLWTTSRHLPGSVASISPILPTRLYADVLWTSSRAAHPRTAPTLGLLAYAALFAFLAVWGYRRDEGERFR